MADPGPRIPIPHLLALPPERKRLENRVGDPHGVRARGAGSRDDRLLGDRVPHRVIPPQVPRDVQGARVGRHGHGGADREDDELRPPAIPTRHAVHPLVEPPGDLPAEIVD